MIEGHLEFKIDTTYLYSPAASGQARRLLVALHGMGMSASSFARVLRHLPDDPERATLIPEGPYPFERRTPDEIKVGHSWYIYRGDQDEFRAHLERSEAHLNRVLEHVAAAGHSVPQDRTLLGFSQGGYLAGFAALRDPARYPRLVIASARLKHEFLTTELASRNLPPTLFIHSAADTATPVERAREGAQLLRDHGASAELMLHDAGHRLPPEGLERLHEWWQEGDSVC